MAVSYRRIRLVTTVAGVVLCSLILAGFALTARLAGHSGVLLPTQISILDRAAYRTTLAHLWLEENIAGDTTIPVSNVWAMIDGANTDLELLLFGGTSDIGKVIPVDDGELSEDLIRTHNLLHEFQALALKRADQEAIAGSDLDHLLDMVFTDLLEGLREESVKLRELGSNQHDDSQQLIALTALILISLTLAFIAMVSFFDRARQRAATSLKQAHDQISTQNERLSLMAHFDALTGCANRMTFVSRLEEETAQARTNGTVLALLFVDLDNFKTINDSLGHDVGDQLLREVAARMSESLAERDLLARLGGDEFTLVLPDFENRETAAEAAGAVAGRLLEDLVRPFELNGSAPIHISASIGIALGPEIGEGAMEMMRRADVAMYGIKGEGKSGYRFYAPELTLLAERRLRMESGLRRALDQSELFTVYQPVVALETGRVVGCEALLRWRDPEVGLIPPDSFIDAAEHNGMIGELGVFVLDETLRLAQQLAADERMPQIYFSINVSARQLNSDRFIEILQDKIERYGIEPHLLQMEITERVLLDTNPVVMQRLSRLRALGVFLALDDFGTGYSSMSVLDRIKLDTLKIDKSFVHRIGRSKQAEALVESIIMMGRSLGTKVIAEGIETIEQLRFLQLRRCTQAQGFHYSKPVPKEELADTILHLQGENAPANQVVNK